MYTYIWVPMYDAVHVMYDGICMCKRKLKKLIGEADENSTCVGEINYSLHVENSSEHHTFNI